MEGIMAGRSPAVASQEQREALAEVAASRDRAEADRARAILLTPEGWTSAHITQMKNERATLPSANFRISA
jgi:hypothetical protein